ncbi:MAG: 50S ribosomal protein L23 [Micavibrio sp.]|nr:50S ribosomal protein L23 [Micavibrio sp.]|tara:strand:- start:1112 stop:1441 length:330 start_codon:yes stop_codon:yes gene_type:complete
MAKEAKKTATKTEVKEQHYKILRSPVVTEKASMGSQYAQVTFRVAVEATKPEIKEAVEAVFGVKVKAVNTLVQKGKVKRFRGIKGQRANFKKAVVSLEEGQVIDMGTGV